MINAQFCVPVTAIDWLTASSLDPEISMRKQRQKLPKIKRLTDFLIKFWRRVKLER
jgi:hypothetical protein